VLHAEMVDRLPVSVFKSGKEEDASWALSCAGALDIRGCSVTITSAWSRITAH